jgi:phospholipid-binding lipoprotein MlaA
MGAGSGAHAAPAQTAESGVQPYDPWEGLNRRTYGFNAGLDRHLFAPITHGYLRATPAPVRRGLSSVVDNFREPRTVLNDLAQGHLGLAGRSASRFVVNSTLGVLGVFDVATPMGLAESDADFGQTLGRYGAEPGPYLVVPVLGPHNLRDALGRLVDTMADPIGLLAGGVTTPFGATRLAASALDYRADADPALAALDDATDPYATLRSAYGQRRAYLVRGARGETEILPDFDGLTDEP